MKLCKIAVILASFINFYHHANSPLEKDLLKTNIGLMISSRYDFDHEQLAPSSNFYKLSLV